MLLKENGKCRKEIDGFKKEFANAGIEKKNTYLNKSVE